MSDSELTTNYAEYSYEKAITGKDKTKRVLYIIGVAVIMLIPLLIAVFFHVYFLIYIMPLVLIIGIPLAKFFFRYFQNEYKYTVDRSKFKIELIHGKAKPKLIYETDVKDMAFVVPATLENEDQYCNFGIDKVAYCCVSEMSPDLYMTSFKSRSGRTILLYFEGSKKALKIMNYYNKNVIISSDLKH